MVETLTTLLLVLLHRAQTMVPLIAIAFFIGEPIARFTGTEWALGRLHRTAAFLARKLDRPARGIATRLYRGMVAVAFLTLPMLALGIVLTLGNGWAQLVGGFFIVAILGHSFATLRLYNEWRAAETGTLPLELTHLNYLFADTHAVLRHLVIRSGEQFASGVVGSAFWFIIGGLPALFVYTALNVLGREYRGRLAFGWAAKGLFQAVDLLPRMLSVLFLTIGACFIPGSKPFALFKARSYHGFLARLLNVSLGGLTPDGQLDWQGDGTPKLLPEHFGRWLLIRLTGTVFLILALSTETIIKLLHIIS